MRRLMHSSLTVLALVGGPAVGGPAAADPISDGQWYAASLRLAEAHKLTKGDGVRVAVIDSGIDASHPDLAGSVVAGTDTSFAGPGDGLTDDLGHGTGMAGLIVGHGRTRGVAPQATVVSIRAESAGAGSPTAVGSAVNWAVAHGIKVISISIAAQDHDRVLEQAVADALAKDVVIVAAAGNTDRKLRVGYPAAYPGVVAVGGTDRHGAHCPAAVSGPEVVLSAPCDTISTPYLKHQRAVGTGTSHATALVAGAAALVRAKFPGLSARDVVHRLTATAADKGTPGRDHQYGFGELDIVAALTADVASLPPQTASAAATVFVTSAPLAAPGEQFPIGIALIVGSVILLLIGAVVLLLAVRRRRPSPYAHEVPDGN